MFFRPIFNFADVSISVGVAIIILFQKKFSRTAKKLEDAMTEHHGQDSANEQALNNQTV
jgi:hypothetical protein